MALTKKEIETFKERLLELKRQHQSVYTGISSDVKSSDEVKGASQHHADEGTDDFDRTISIQVSSSEIKTMKQIDRALDKIEEGTYGICDLTGEEIAKKRLEAIPYATTTLKAQEMLEKGLLS